MAHAGTPAAGQWGAPPPAPAPAGPVTRVPYVPQVVRDQIRNELREATARVVRQNRRVAALVGLHRRVNQEILELVLADEDSNPLRQTGALVDAEV